MKRCSPLILILLMVVSCQFNVDNSNPLKVAKALHKGLSQNDSIILNQIFESKINDLSGNSKSYIREAKEFFMYNKKSIIIKIDTLDSEFYGYKNIDIYYKLGEEFYRIRGSYELNSSKIVKLNNFSFINLNKECMDYENSPYCPFYDITFKNLTWLADNNKMTFKYGIIQLQNNTGIDLNYIKFRLVLKSRIFTDSEKIYFNQTIESYQPIFKGDIVRIEILGMKDYFTGSKIDEIDLIFEPRLLEVRPKPASDWCLTLKELQEM